MLSKDQLKQKILMDRYRNAGRRPGSKNTFPTKQELNLLLQESRAKALEGDQVASVNVLLHTLLRELQDYRKEKEAF